MDRKPLRFAVASILLASVVGMIGSASASSHRTTAPTSAGSSFDRAAVAGGGGSVVRVFQRDKPWTSRHLKTLNSLGLERDADYFVQPMKDLQNPIPRNTSVVIISSNSSGSTKAADQESDPVAQKHLSRFVHRGGVLIVDLADNLEEGGYAVPGAKGTPDAIFPPGNVCGEATLTAAAVGPDGVLHTPDDHPFVRGPDGEAGTADDLGNGKIDMAPGYCYVAHGTLVDGITLPERAEYLETATFHVGEVGERPILGDYCLGEGRVIVDTVTKEFVGHKPVGIGPSFFLINLFSWAMSPAGHHCRGTGF
jgi:hypothetical protein